MNGITICGVALAWLAILAGGWLGWQLLRQNGRILMRLDELEKRLNELEFGSADEPEGLPLGSDAPAFELADLADGRKSLAQFRGQPVLLVFFNPECGFCREMMPKLAAFCAGSTGHWPVPPGGSPGGIASAPAILTNSPSQRDPPVVPFGESPNGAGGSPALPKILILTTGDVEKNRQFFVGHELSCPVLLQNDGEVAKAYQANGTPSGYLISAEGKIASELAMGAEALLALAAEDPDPKSEVGSQKSEEDQSFVASAAPSRFSNRSLARSRIKRDGLKAGTLAPDFRLPRLDGRGDLSLEELRSRRVLLVFSSPHCGPCDTLALELEKFHRKQCGGEHPLTLSLSPSEGERENLSDVAVVMISRGEPKENRVKVKEQGLTFPIVLQQQWEISRRYAMFATPVAYLINEQGVIAHDVAVGSDAILELMSRTLPPLEQFSPAVR